MEADSVRLGAHSLVTFIDLADCRSTSVTGAGPDLGATLEFDAKTYSVAGGRVLSTQPTACPIALDYTELVSRKHRKPPISVPPDPVLMFDEALRESVFNVQIFCGLPGENVVVWQKDGQLNWFGKSLQSGRTCSLRFQTKNHQFLAPGDDKEFKVVEPGAAAENREVLFYAVKHDSIPPYP
jgi:hypothetical protein